MPVGMVVEGELKPVRRSLSLCFLGFKDRGKKG
jgi:hypothetical protein